MSVKDIKESLSTAFSGNVRKSFFGGVVSSRLQAQDLGRVVTADVEQAHLRAQSRSRSTNAAKPSRQPDGAAASQPVQRVDQEAIKAARRQAQVEERKKAAARNASMFDGSANDACGDVIAPVKPSVPASKPGRGALSKTIAAPLLATQGKPEPKRQGNSQQASRHSNGQQHAHSSQKQQIEKQSAKPKLNLQPTAAQKATGIRSGQSLTALRSKAELHAKAARNGGRQRQIEKSLPPSKPKPTKVCRNCQTDTPLKDYFCEKRCPDGLMHMCMKCASKKGLSGKPATAELIAAIMKERNAAVAPGGARPSGARSSAPTASHAPSRANGAGPGPSPTAPQARGSPAQRRGEPGAQQRHAAPSMQGKGTLKGFYGSASRGAGPVARAVASGRHLRQREDLDEYEDDFVEEDEEGEDWRAQLREVTGGWRRRHDDFDDEGDDRMMEASAAEVRREEARSRRMGRQEDMVAEREEAARVAAKAAAKRARAVKKTKKRKKKRTGVSAFLNDEASEEDDEDSEDYSE